MTDEELKQLFADNARFLQALSQDVSRLVETQQALSRDVSHLVETQQEAARERQELRQLTESNARSIQAFADSVAADREQMQADREQMRDAILRLTRVQEGIANLVASLDEDRPTILRKLNSIESKIDRILDKE